MKILVALIISSFLTLSGIAQTTAKITLIFKSINKNTSNFQVMIDQTSYYSNTNTKNLKTYKVDIDDVPVGTHTLKLYRLKSNNPVNNGKLQNIPVYSKTFELREGFDMNITILVNGRVQFTEQAVPATSSPTNVRTPMTSNKFNLLVENIKAKWSQSLKGETIRDAIIATNSYFSTAQIKALLGLITSESDRLELVKLAYSDITDPANYYQLADLFNSTAHREEFNVYAQSQAGQSPTSTVQMTDSRFNQLLQEVRNNWSQSLKAETVRSAFVNTGNYFSTSQIRQLLTQITSESNRLDLIKLAHRGVTDPANFASLVNLFNSTAYRTEFNSFVALTGGQVQNTAKAQMSTTQFNQLLQSVKDKWSQSLKGEAIRDAFVNSNNYFSTSQIRQLLTLVTSESDKLELAKLSFRGVTDPENFSTLADLFSISSNRTEFNNYVIAQGGTTTGNTTIKTAMAEGDFNMLVLTVRSNLVQPLKANALRNTFSNPSYYFTSSQVKELISLINSETSRLELAKLSYRTVTDRQNFNLLNDVLPTQSNREKLAEYVRTYTGE
ncbi:DUF4476 domain-containing protein [Pedobacter sp. P351]|uniref:DUF4476 domain-containing protein n=1 Tax=Pedobacter superstes TaxID=3133441 RepID=UPI0030A9D6BA